MRDERKAIDRAWAALRIERENLHNRAAAGEVILNAREKEIDVWEAEWARASRAQSRLDEVRDIVKSHTRLYKGGAS
jgi:hypothetical protein